MIKTSNISEAKLTKMIMSHLKKVGCFHWKVSDRATSGLPDICGCFNGRFFAIEIKATGKKARNMQIYQLNRIKKSGGCTLVTDSYAMYLQFMEALIEAP